MKYSHLFFSCLSSLALLADPTHGVDQYHPFYGLLHGHTSYSDGSGTPDEAFQMARDSGCDFFAITEHNHSEAGGNDGVSLTPALYNRLKASAGTHTENGRFVALYGQEFSTISSGNHVNIFNASEICRVPSGDFRMLYETWLPAHPEVPLIQFNHPDYRQDLHNASEKPKARKNDYGLDDYNESFSHLVAASDGKVALIEMIIGPAFNRGTTKQHRHGSHERDYLFYLNQGYTLGPSVGQDNHNKNWGTSTKARLGIWATELTKDSVYESLTSMRCFASEDENVRVKFLVNGRWMGETVPVQPGASVELKIDIADPNESSAEYQVVIYYDDGPNGSEAQKVAEDTLNGDGSLTLTHVPVVRSYYFAKITQKSTVENESDDIWTSPVWIAGAGEPDHPETDVIEWNHAGDYVGREMQVTGKVVRTFRSVNAFFFNFNEDYENTLSLVIRRQDFPVFGDIAALEQRYSGKGIRATGEISEYRGRIQILLTNTAQIAIATEN